MEINQLRVIDAIARTGSITAAAEELHYAQASVSHHLGRLQHDIGTPLTRRRGRGLVLTQEGELLATRAREILRRLDQTRVEVDALHREMTTRLRIAAFQSALLHLVPPVLDQLRRTHTDTALELRESHPDDALNQLRDNEVDVALVHHPDDRGFAHPFHAVKLYDDPMYLLSTTPDDTVERHRHSNWIAGCDRCRAGIEAVCLNSGFEPRIGLRTEDIHVQASFVAAGLGVITMPGTALRGLNMRVLSATRIAEPLRRVWAVTRATHSGGIAEEFVDILSCAVTPSSNV